MRSTSRLLAIGAATVAVVLGSASTAMADSGTINDKRYDVFVSDSDDLGSPASDGTYHQRVTAGYVDAKNLSVNHGKDFVAVRLNMNKLGEGVFIAAAVKVNGGTADDYQLYAAADGMGGIYAESAPGDSVPAVAPPVICSSAPSTNRIKGTSKTGTNGYIQLYVPRACFASPKHVRLGATTRFFEFGGAPTVAPSSLKQFRKGVKSTLVDETSYADPINSKYFGAPEYTSWLARN